MYDGGVRRRYGSSFAHAREEAREQARMVRFLVGNGKQLKASIAVMAEQAAPAGQQQLSTSTSSVVRAQRWDQVLDVDPS